MNGNAAANELSEMKEQALQFMWKFSWLFVLSLQTISKLFSFIGQEAFLTNHSLLRILHLL